MLWTSIGASIFGWMMCTSSGGTNEILASSFCCGPIRCSRSLKASSHYLSCIPYSFFISSISSAFSNSTYYFCSTFVYNSSIGASFASSLYWLSVLAVKTISCLWLCNYCYRLIYAPTFSYSLFSVSNYSFLLFWITLSNFNLISVLAVSTISSGIVKGFS